MLVVADSSPLNFLIRLGFIDVLPALFGNVIIPNEVAEELTRLRTPEEVRRYIAAPPPWLRVQAPKRFEPIDKIHQGEAAAICLAIELGADLLLIDDAAWRRAARERAVAVAGTVGVLEKAADRGLVNLADAFARLKEQRDFWIDPRLLDDRLLRFRARHGSMNS